MPSENYNKKEQVAALDLKKAFVDGLAVLGRPPTEIILEELKRQGMDLDNEDRTYSLDQLERMLVVILGTDVPTLVMDRIKAQLRKE